MNVKMEELRPSVTTICTDSRNSFMSPVTTTAFSALFIYVYICVSVSTEAFVNIKHKASTAWIDDW
jgi:hypothetical protein